MEVKQAREKKELRTKATGGEWASPLATVCAEPERGKMANLGYTGDARKRKSTEERAGDAAYHRVGHRGE